MHKQIGYGSGWVYMGEGVYCMRMYMYTYAED